MLGTLPGLLVLLLLAGLLMSYQIKLKLHQKGLSSANIIMRDMIILPIPLHMVQILVLLVRGLHLVYLLLLASHIYMIFTIRQDVVLNMLLMVQRVVVLWGILIVLLLHLLILKRFPLVLVALYHPILSLMILFLIL